ncbi:hypothetical protein [Streptomyces sp. SID10815]|uniref:hypothetical protein n=1 Tax=Streptomyces sp. SID10815 TaxID=2706027 RepID=UPI001EF17BB5|nr:hypothetical protein [Streptomyces sp. SID10815]
MNWAELRDLVVALPEDSATKAALAGDMDGRRWNATTFLGAAQYNALLILIRILWAAHLKGHPPEMEPVDPPRIEAAEADDEARAAAQQRTEAYLDSFSPGRTQADQAEIDDLQAKIRELETTR